MRQLTNEKSSMRQLINEKPSMRQLTNERPSETELTNERLSMRQLTNEGPSMRQLTNERPSETDLTNESSPWCSEHSLHGPDHNLVSNTRLPESPDDDAEENYSRIPIYIIMMLQTDELTVTDLSSSISCHCWICRWNLPLCS